MRSKGWSVSCQRRRWTIRKLSGTWACVARIASARCNSAGNRSESVTRLGFMPDDTTLVRGRQAGIVAKCVAVIACSATRSPFELVPFASVLPAIPRSGST
jgi:hypothetical protein